MTTIKQLEERIKKEMKVASDNFTALFDWSKGFHNDIIELNKKLVNRISEMDKRLTTLEEAEANKK